ncbi:disulfide oxidoreductase, putative [Talaromyces stipitatus ATCC 10500]|uniref:Disulfide oxidoreductase, putative n=1 Tax=Talaromyces stipitatus (strain ATCC 10500 / CBS 375.48 / QM 6759 / NRRL 1006) TaxID=441959 RepID=B8M683_TALSN|nr:disulfide oxidoreductase, putative [Talaromyces stipitatus ATCC 10500]EED19083.1 disulfide oxidoreductase, putative [Talaromyces stipitatus ATCC 10500]
MNRENMKTILILGGSFAGVGTAHRILKQASKTNLDVKVILVSPNTHLYWNIASPRAILPDQFTDEKLFGSIDEGFRRYPDGQFEHIIGFANRLDTVNRKVEVSIDAEGTESVATVSYNFLIIATGSRSKVFDEDVKAPFKGLGSTEATRDALHAFQELVKNSKTIVVAGGGPTGVETAGELGFEYGKDKKIILATSGQTVLETAIPSVSKTALGMLRDLNVDVKLQTKVSRSSRTKREGTNQLDIYLSDGNVLSADLYIPTSGIIPNSSFIPDKYVNTNGFVKVDEYLQVKGFENQRVWAIGDVSDLEPPQLMCADRQSGHLAKNIGLILNNKTPLPYKGGIHGMGCQIGRKTGTGQLGWVKLPSFLIHFLRKHLFVERLEPTVDGSVY